MLYIHPVFHATASNAATSNAAEYLTFRLGQEEYGIDILRVQEIRSMSSPRAGACAGLHQGRD